MASSAVGIFVEKCAKIEEKVMMDGKNVNLFFLIIPNFHFYFFKTSSIVFIVFLSKIFPMFSTFSTVFLPNVINAITGSYQKNEAKNCSLVKNCRQNILCMGKLLGYELIFGLLMMIANPVETAINTYTSNVIKIDTELATASSGIEPTCPRDRAFFVEFNVGKFVDGCELHFCYISHFDKNYVQKDGIHLMEPFMINNKEGENEISVNCNQKASDYYNGQSVNALHGFRFKRVGNTLNVTNSFSSENFLIDLNSINSDKLRIKFGTDTKNLITKFFAANNGTVEIFPVGMRIPSDDVLSSMQKMREAFRANPGFWLTSLDIAFFEEFGNNSRRFHFAIAGCNQEIPISYGSENLTNVHWNATNDFPKPNSKAICKTSEVFVNAAIIRDRFLEMFKTFTCEKENRLDCPFSDEIDYAVRVGCLECAQEFPWINELFLDALSDWAKSKDRQTLEQWSADKNDLVKFKENREELQPINQIDAGKYIYFPVPKEWIQQKSVKMLAHTCGGYGIFLSAFKAAENTNDPINIQPIYDWEKDFEFLENCRFLQNEVKSTTYKVKDTTHYAKALDVPMPIGFGTEKIIKNNSEERKEPIKLKDEEILQIKFKYDMNVDLKKYPRRNNKYVIEKNYMKERINFWGHYLLPVDKMFEKYNNNSKFTYFGFFNIEQKLQDETVIGKDFYKNADVKAIIFRMKMKCGDLLLSSTRIWSIQEVTYGVDGEMEPKKSTNYFQTRAYQFNKGKYFEPDINSENFKFNPFLYNYTKTDKN